MKRQEAYQALGLNINATQDEVKKAFKKLAAKYHPDVNKDENAVENFKKVNSAYQAIESNKFDDSIPQQQPFNGHSDFFNFSDFFNINNRGRTTKTIIVEDIHLNTTISFKESVLGCNKNITYKRKLKCSACNGNGEIHKPNNCKACNGQGRVFNQQKNMVIASLCPTCKGIMNYEACKICNSNGSLESESTVQVKIPAGVSSSSVLRLTGMGHFYGEWEGYSSAFLKINVVPEEGLTLLEQDVISEINISLLEALQGCKKKVNTIDGEKEIDINKLIKNKEEFILPGLGVNRVGNQRVIVNVSYPENIDKLIEALV